jgi:peptidoglycan/xylan/chitin deacetylase (PgdA/CDA1 family)
MPLVTSTIATLAHAVPGTRRNRLLILIYHRVRPEPSVMSRAALHRDMFDWQMQLVARHCAPISMLDGLGRMREGTLPPRSVAITFDDGYADNADVALPVLLRHGVPATFFVATGFLNGGRMWNDSIVEAIRRARGAQVDLRAIGLGVMPLGPVQARGPLAQRVIRQVKHLPPKERERKVAEICGAIGAELPDDLMMTSAQVRSLARAGMEVGAHTVHHPILRSLDEAEAKCEITDSRAELESIVGTAVRSFAYPNGRPGDDYSVRDRNIVASLDFEYAVSTTQGAAGAGSDIFQLPRFTPWDSTPGRWLARLLLAFGRPA